MFSILIETQSSDPSLVRFFPKEKAWTLTDELSPVGDLLSFRPTRGDRK